MSEDRLPLNSQDIQAERLAALQEFFPEVFTEGKIDFERLKQALGESVDEGRERYGLSWAGKSEAIRNLQAQSMGTLNPVPEESVNFETTENLFIEGDNLEVLKLLQKSYYNQIKMIYIDPPYNRGGEFIYPDNFQEGLEDYLRYSGQKSDEGVKLTTKTEANGRYHSRWLSMMYPRLFTARNLLCEEGVIFISIDDNEAHNLRLIANEVFGEENFIACICWQKKYAPSNDTVDFSATHDFILVYAKQRKFLESGKLAALLSKIERTEEQNKLYKNLDNDPRGLWRTDNYVCNKTAEQRPNLYYPIFHPKTGKEIFPNQTAVWRYSKERHQRNVEENRVWWGINQENKVPAYKRFLSDVGGVIANTWWIHKDVGHNDEAKKQIKTLFPEAAQIFDTPKPTRLIKRILELATDLDTSDIVLDFFAGSSTTAHAVLDLNRTDGGNRRFIMVQLPESLDNPQFKTIADISKERIRRTINKINEEENGKLDLNGTEKQDRGFKVFKLTESNFKIWDGTAPQNAEQLSLMLEEFAANIRPGATKLGMLYEILLKAGFPLTAKIEKLDIAGQEIYAIEDQELFICLEDEILEETIRQILTYQPQPKQFISLDSSFRGNDQLKTNTQLQMRDRYIKFRTV